MSAKLVNKKEKKEQILMAALEIFGQKGFSKTTISDIAQAADMGKGTVYEYFSTKEEIIQSSFGFFMSNMGLDFEMALGVERPAVEKLRLILSHFADFMTDQTRKLMELMFDFWSEGIKDKKVKGILYGEMLKFYHSYRDIFSTIIVQGMGEGTIRKDISPQSASALLVGALDGIMVQWILESHDFDYQDVVKTISLTFLDGIIVIRN